MDCLHLPSSATGERLKSKGMVGPTNEELAYGAYSSKGEGGSHRQGSLSARIGESHKSRWKHQSE